MNGRKVKKREKEKKKKEKKFFFSSRRRHTRLLTVTGVQTVLFRSLGLAFQIMDDLLDTYGEGEKVGKKIGGDILNNKKTFLMISALNQADESRKKDMIALFDEKNDEVKIKAMIEHFDALDVEKITRDKMESLYQKALSDLDAISLPDERKQGLRELASAVYNRDF